MKPHLKLLGLAVLALALFTTGCSLSDLGLFGSPTLTPSPTSPPADTPVPSTPLPSETPTATDTPDPATVDEAISIIDPGPGSRITSPVLITGVGELISERKLTIEIVLDDGSVVLRRAVRTDEDPGVRGPFGINLAFNVEGDRQGFIKIFETDPRDGGILHMASVGVTLSENGPPELQIQEPGTEQIVLWLPSRESTVSGGVAHVEGFGLASFEQNLIVEVLNGEGVVIGSRPVTVEAPDLGMPGPFTTDVLYSVDAPQRGRIVVRDPSPVGGDAHVASVEVLLEP